jgi:hypothetical protein
VQDPQASPHPTEQPRSTPPNAAPRADRRHPEASQAAGPAPQGAPPNGTPPRWGESGYQPPPDSDQPSRMAVAWISGVTGALGLVAATVVGFAILFAVGHRAPAPVSGAPPPTLPGQAPGQTPDQAPGQGSGGTAGAGPETTLPGLSGRIDTAAYSIHLPDGFRDVTDAYHTEHPDEGGVVQALAQVTPAVQPPPEIVISQLREGFGSGQSLTKIAQSRAGALVQGANGPDAPRHSTLGPDPSVEIGVPLQSGGQRTEVIVKHSGRVWQISVIDPGKGETDARQAWRRTVQPGWQWR